MASGNRVTVSTFIWVWDHTPLKWILPGTRHLRHTNGRLFGRKGFHGPRGTGILRDHIVVDLFGFEALCGQPVYSIGGSGGEADCWSCKRLAKRARSLNWG